MNDCNVRRIKSIFAFNYIEKGYEIKMTNTKAILASIDNVNDTVMEADLSVINAMASSYEKASFIMENYTGDEQNMFSIFQEDMKDWLAKKDNESIITQIVKFLPRMLYKLWNFIKSAWSGDVVKESKSVLDKASDAFDKVKGTIGKLANVDENWFEQNKKKIAVIGGGIGAVGLTTFAVFNRKKITSLVTDFVGNLENIVPEIKQKRQNRKIIFKILISGDIETNVSFKKILKIFQAIPQTFTILKDMKKRGYKDAETYMESLMKVADDVKKTASNYTDIIADQTENISMSEFVDVYANMINTMDNITESDNNSFNIIDETMLKYLENMSDEDKKKFESASKIVMDTTSQNNKLSQFLLNNIKNNGLIKHITELAKKFKKADLSQIDELDKVVENQNKSDDEIDGVPTEGTDDLASDSTNESTSTTSSSTDTKDNSAGKGSNDHVGESWYSM